MKIGVFTRISAGFDALNARLVLLMLVLVPLVLVLVLGARFDAHNAGCNSLASKQPQRSSKL